MATKSKPKPSAKPAAKPKKKHGPGAPKAPLNLKRIRALAANFCSLDEIAAAQGVAGRTLLRRKQEPEVLAAIESGKSNGRARLRALLWKMAQKGNVAAAIFLAKQVAILAYSDKTEMQHVGEDGGPILHTITVEFVRPDDPPEPV